MRLSERNKNLYLLLATLFHNLIYPISTGPGLQPLVYYSAFTPMLVLAVFLFTRKRALRMTIIAAGGGFFLCGNLNAYAPSDAAQLGLYFSAIVYHLIMIIVLVDYVFLSAERVLLPVILAATSLYLIFGSMYAPIYALIEFLEPNSFAVASGAEINWQRLLYYSYVTLTTVGYGDITPIRFYAQSFATFEAVAGQLYLVILLSRLVSLYEDEHPQGENA